MEISFKTKEHPTPRKVEYDFPETLADLIKRFGEESVFEFAVGGYTISIQALARRHIEKSDEEIQDIINNWDPNTRASSVRKSAAEKVSAAIGQLSPEEKASLLAKLQASLGL